MKEMFIFYKKEADEYGLFPAVLLQFLREKLSDRPETEHEGHTYYSWHTDELLEEINFKSVATLRHAINKLVHSKAIVRKKMGRLPHYRVNEQ